MEIAEERFEAALNRGQSRAAAETSPTTCERVHDATTWRYFADLFDRDADAVADDNDARLAGLMSERDAAAGQLFGCLTPVRSALNRA